MSNMKFSCVFLMLFLVLISGCNGGGSDTDSAASIRGIAAAGAPIVGTVNIRGANGKTSDNEINADGTYRVDVSALTAPFLIWAEGTANGNNVKLYTTVDTAKKNANITPATNLVLTMALGQDPAAVYKNDPDAEVPDSSEIVSAEKQVQALLSRVFDSLGMPEDFNLMKGMP
ncbi:MAG: hypothetical protein CSA29_05610 [Desulfobacterales bacterium]|nr:MAG: hypothetical protein CSA29_05610 [Desulfobacterales bacterium]